MEFLRQRLFDITALIPARNPIVYLDYPVHTNIGDLLIERGADHFLSYYGYNVVERRSYYDFCACAVKRVDRDMTILLHGGGNFGDLYDQHQVFREKIIETFPHNRIVLLPQTIHFESNERLRTSAAIFARHENLHVCLRDERSFEIFQRHFANPAYLTPDMAHFLWGEFAQPKPRQGAPNTLVFARKDKELRELPPVGNGHQQPIDWIDVVRPQDEFIHRALRKLHVKHCRICGHWSLYPAWRTFLRDRLIARAERLVSDYDAVVTNRLHMAILALLMGRKVVMADNSYGKLSSYYSAWLKDIPQARLAS